MIKRRLESLRGQRRGRGQAMVEFAIVAMVMLTLILGIIQFALIYHAKITLNYAAFETARAGALNNARMWAMELAFARSMAPLYTTPYVVEGADEKCKLAFELGDAENATFSLDNVKCARRRIRSMIDSNLVRILLVNPSAASFTDHGYNNDGARTIPNDNLMYRSAEVKATSSQSVQDANLVKVHIGFCYELIVPLVDNLLVRMMSLNPTALQPENFGPLPGGSFGESCIRETNVDGSARNAIPLYAQGLVRMQSDAILDSFTSERTSPGAVPSPLPVGR